MIKIDYFRHVLLRNNRLSYNVLKGTNVAKNIQIIGMIRCRNESLIIKDTLDHLADKVDGVVIYDDASNDDTVKRALAHPLTIAVLQNKKWRKAQRAWEETANRKLLHDYAIKYKPKWFLYIDADERIDGNVRGFLTSRESNGIDGVRVSLFDAYLTKQDKKAYEKGALFNFRKFFGVERREILMIWRNLPDINYNLPKPDMREPHGLEGKKIITKFYCQHYGKAISIQQWEDTCEYYARNFPMYAEKWDARRGKAIHTTSDFGTNLKSWDELKKDGGILLG